MFLRSCGPPHSNPSSRTKVAEQAKQNLLNEGWTELSGGRYILTACEKYGGAARIWTGDRGFGSVDQIMECETNPHRSVKRSDLYRRVKFQSSQVFGNEEAPTFRSGSESLPWRAGQNTRRTVRRSISRFGGSGRSILCGAGLGILGSEKDVRVRSPPLAIRASRSGISQQLARRRVCCLEQCVGSHCVDTPS